MIFMYKSKITDKEIMDEWAEFAAMGTNSRIRSKYREGQKVTYKGEEWFIKEYEGRNIWGNEEYYIEKPDGAFGEECIYVTEEDIEPVEVRESTPPPVPKKVVKCDHNKAYLNKCLTFEFWVCPDCQEEVDDPNKKQLSQKEIDDLFDEFERMLD
jgi:hypothetical protein